MKRTNKKKPVSALSKQMKRKQKKDKENKHKDGEKIGGDYGGNFETMVSTGSTLLDLAISGGRKRGGGIPGGIFVEVFGPSSAGKTVLLCEIAGSVQRQGGDIMFKDPEARLDKRFASMFGLNVDNIDYSTPDQVPDVFEPIRAWEPEDEDVINGIFADSLAALSTEMEMEGNDKYGGRRAKEFSEELRRTCRVIKNKNMLLVGSNQIRDKFNAMPFEENFTVPGGHALEFYASLRLRFHNPKKLYKKKKIAGKTVKRYYGVESKVSVYKSSVWRPFMTAPVRIVFDYGVDDIYNNLQFVKDYTKNTVYTLGGENLANSMDKSIEMVEEEGKEGLQQLREDVITLWEEIENKFKMNRKEKIRL